MNRRKDDQEYEARISEMESLMASDPDPESEDGFRLSELINYVEQYEAKWEPRVMGWLCASCNRSYSPTVESCSACVRAVCAPHPEQINQQHYNDHLDHMIQCDANFKGRGC